MESKDKYSERWKKFKENALDYMDTIRDVGTNGEINEENLKILYKKNGIVRNIIDAPAEDATREWFEVTIEGDESGEIQKKLYEEFKNIKLKEVTEKMMKYELLVGGSVVYFRVNGPGEFKDELKKYKGLKKLQVFPKSKVKKVNKEEDLKAENYGDVKNIVVETGSGEEEIHESRIHIYSPRKFLDDVWGSSIMESVYEPITLLYNFYWSSGEVAYAMTFKVLKSKGIDLTDIETWKKIQTMIGEEFNSTTTAVIGAEDSLEQHGSGGKIPDLKAMGDVFWEHLSACCRIPVAILKGNQMGKLSGAEYDAINYFNRISGLQENALRPFHEKVIKMKLKELGHEGKKYELKYSSLWKLDEKTVAEIRKMNTEADKNEAATLQTLMLSGAVTAKDVQGKVEEILTRKSTKMNSKERDELRKKVTKKITESRL